MEKSKLVRAAGWAWKRLPGNSLYFFLQGEFAPDDFEGAEAYSRSLMPAAKHVIYAGAAIATLIFGYVGPEMDKQLNRQNSQAQVEIINK